MILVTGATGNLGRHLVPRLQTAGLPFRVLEHRTPVDGVPSVPGDAADPASLPPAFAGVDTLFLLSPYTPDLAANERNLIDAAKAAGVGPIVKLSVVGADPDAVSTVLSGHGISEAYLREAGIPFTAIRANSFMQNIPAFFGQPVRDGAGIAVAAGEGAVAWIDLADLADAVVAVLKVPPQDETIELTGPQALSYRDVADLLAGQTGRPVQYHALTEDQSRDGMVEAGFPQWLSDGFAAYFTYQAQGGFSRVTPTLAELIGRPPTRLADVLAAEAGAFA